MSNPWPEAWIWPTTLVYMAHLNYTRLWLFCINVYNVRCCSQVPHLPQCRRLSLPIVTLLMTSHIFSRRDVVHLSITSQRYLCFPPSSTQYLSRLFSSLKCVVTCQPSFRKRCFYFLLLPVKHCSVGRQAVFLHFLCAAHYQADCCLLGNNRCLCLGSSQCQLLVTSIFVCRLFVIFERCLTVWRRGAVQWI